MDSEPKLLGSKDAAKYLGISRTELHRRVKDGLLSPSSSVASRWLKFDIKELDRHRVSYLSALRQVDRTETRNE